MGRRPPAEVAIVNSRFATQDIIEFKSDGACRFNATHRLEWLDLVMV